MQISRDPLGSVSNTQIADRLADLEERRRHTSITDLSSRPFPVDLICTIPDVFQPRMSAVNEKHIGDLINAFRAVGDLTPILALPIGDHVVVIDGHHRLEAYRMERRPNVPVEFFKGTVREAVLQSGASNSKAIIPLSLSQRTDWAWKLVRMSNPDDPNKHLFSKRRIATSAGVSSGTVAAMRRAAKALGDTGDISPHWFLARMQWQEQDAPDAYQTFGDQELEERAQHVADRLAKAIGTRRATNPEIMARGLIKFLGRNTPDVIKEMVARCNEDPALFAYAEQLADIGGWADEDEEYSADWIHPQQ